MTLPRQVVKKYDIPVAVLKYDSKAIAWFKKIDLLYIDGGHSCEQVKGDIENFSKWVRRGGYMIFDDYGKKHLQVTEAVDDCVGNDWDTFLYPPLWWMICRRL